MTEKGDVSQNTIEWFFDFLSPFAYFQFKELETMEEVNIVYRPILFAGLLKHWSHLGPAEIPEKRVMTYQYCHWHAANKNIPYKTPPSHPFNPLPVLRLAISQQNSPEVIGAIFHRIWAEGTDITDHDNWKDLTSLLGIAEPEEVISQPWVKETLKTNTNRAIELGLFGVPTIVTNDKLFWGHDMTEMALIHMKNPNEFTTGEYERLANLPLGQARK